MKKSNSYRYLLNIVILAGLMTTWACHATYYKIPITKSRPHWRPYDDSKDRGKKRVKIKSYKSLSHTKRINEKK